MQFIQFIYLICPLLRAPTRNKSNITFLKHNGLNNIDRKNQVDISKTAIEIGYQYKASSKRLYKPTNKSK